jgi:hypothetical protein
MMFQNVILPEASIGEMRGVSALLTLIANPQSEAAQAFLARLSAEKDAAEAASKKAAEDRIVAERTKAEVAARSEKMDAEIAAAVDDAIAKHESATRAQLTDIINREKEVSSREHQHQQRAAEHAGQVREFEAKAASWANERAAFEVRVKALESKNAVDRAELDRKQREFDAKMAPILAAAQLAR